MGGPALSLHLLHWTHNIHICQDSCVQWKAAAWYARLLPFMNQKFRTAVTLCSSWGSQTDPSGACLPARDEFNLLLTYVAPCLWPLYVTNLHTSMKTFLHAWKPFGQVFEEIWCWNNVLNFCTNCEGQAPLAPGFFSSYPLPVLSVVLTCGWLPWLDLDGGLYLFDLTCNDRNFPFCKTNSIIFLNLKIIIMLWSTLLPCWRRPWKSLNDKLAIVITTCPMASSNLKIPCWDCSCDYKATSLCLHLKILDPQSSYHLMQEGPVLFPCNVDIVQNPSQTLKKAEKKEKNLGYGRENCNPCTYPRFREQQKQNQSSWRHCREHCMLLGN